MKKTNKETNFSLEVLYQCNSENYEIEAYVVKFGNTRYLYKKKRVVHEGF